MKYLAVVFDMDGVLIDARDWHYRALNEALKIFGCEIGDEEQASKFDGLPTKVKLDLLSVEGRLPRHLHGVVEEIKQERTLREAASLCFPKIEHLLMIARIRAMGLKVGVATNSIRATTETMLSFAGILETLDVLVTNQDVKLAKPHPDIYLESARLLEVNPGQILVVEDSKYGIASAQKAGCTVIEVKGPSDVNFSLIEAALQNKGKHANHY